MNRNMFNILKHTLLSAALPLACLSSAHAVSLDFTLPGVATGNGQEQILNYYNGGADQYGNVGPNYGITFGSDALVLGQYAQYPGYSNTGNEPGGGNALFFLTGSADVMDIAAGFTTGFSFYYCAGLTGSITVWSGLDGTGTLLASLSLPAVGVQGTTEPFFGLNGWTPIGVSFAGTAESVEFGGTANQITFADVTLGSVNPIIPSVPDNTGMNICVLAGLVLAGAGWAFGKQRSATV